jgi:hypothetical protein
MALVKRETRGESETRRKKVDVGTPHEKFEGQEGRSSSIIDPAQERATRGSVGRLWSRQDGIQVWPTHHPRSAVTASAPWLRTFFLFSLFSNPLKKWGFLTDRVHMPHVRTCGCWVQRYGWILMFAKPGKSGAPAEFTGYFSLLMRFLLQASLIIMHPFSMDLDLMFIHRDICTNKKCQICFLGA